VKRKCEAAGWKPGDAIPEPGKPGQPDPNANSPHRLLAQALMKRAMADIPMVQHIQKESPGMNRLYAQSMCSVKQWRAYQAAESLVSMEVEEVRTEADSIEAGWSNVIWRQAMQYQSVLKQKHEAEQKAAMEEAKKRKQVEAAVSEAKKKMDAPKVVTEEQAEKLAEELIKAEEREKQSKKSFAAGSKTIKKGFLDSKGGKKK
jgi:Preprotein translocase subunit Sec66